MKHQGTTVAAARSRETPSSRDVSPYCRLVRVPAIFWAAVVSCALSAAGLALNAHHSEWGSPATSSSC
jgi:hypothetical protein